MTGLSRTFSPDDIILTSGNLFRVPLVVGLNGGEETGRESGMHGDATIKEKKTKKSLGEGRRGKDKIVPIYRPGTPLRVEHAIYI